MLYYLYDSGVRWHQSKGGLADGVPGFDSRAMHAETQRLSGNERCGRWPGRGTASELKLALSMLCRGCSHSHGQEQLLSTLWLLLLSPHPSDGSIITSITAADADDAASASTSAAIVIIVISIAVLLDAITILTMPVITTTTTITTTTVICGVQGFARAAVRGGLQGRRGMVCGT